MRILRKPVLTNKLSFVAFLSVLSVIIGAMQARPVLADTISYNAIIANTPVDLSNVSLNFTGIQSIARRFDRGNARFDGDNKQLLYRYRECGPNGQGYNISVYRLF